MDIGLERELEPALAAAASLVRKHQSSLDAIAGHDLTHELEEEHDEQLNKQRASTFPQDYNYAQHVRDLKYKYSTFSRLGAGVCRLGNCSCYPWWRQHNGNKTEAEEACRQEDHCVAFAFDTSFEKDNNAFPSYQLFFSEPGKDRNMKPRGGEKMNGGLECLATDIDRADSCLPQFECYKKEFPGSTPRSQAPASKFGILVTCLVSSGACCVCLWAFCVGWYAIFTKKKNPFKPFPRPDDPTV
jgi:hypothetical protein